MKHTQGKWVVLTPLQTKSGRFIVGIKDKSFHAIATINDKFPLHNDGEANANLIAAAPEMLEVLQILQMFTMLNPNAFRDIKGLILRANEVCNKIGGKQ